MVLSLAAFHLPYFFVRVSRSASPPAREDHQAADRSQAGNGRYSVFYKIKTEVPGQEKEEAKPFDPVEHRRSIWRAHYHRHRDRLLAEKNAKNAKKKAGKLAVQPVKTPAEIAAEAEAKRQRKQKYQREYQREWNRRRKEAMKDMAQENAV